MCVIKGKNYKTKEMKIYAEHHVNDKVSVSFMITSITIEMIR